jgi:hypothetical protein
MRALPSPQDARPLAPLPFFLSLMPPNSQDALKFVPAEFKHLLAPDSPVADLVRTCLMKLLASARAMQLVGLTD